ncbi:LCP family protein [Nakamurella sp. A5-74]|uniref:LCP family protein n=1 Tax=Nakamurella sp. A5-74 TaxID=3158264 RepID=A0AAU8DQN2_9ACTN
MGSTQGRSAGGRGLLLTGRAVVIVVTIAVLAGLGTAFVIHQRAGSAIAANSIDDALFADDPNLRSTTAAPGSPGSDAPAGPGTSAGGTHTGSPASSGSPAPSVSPEDAAAKPAENILILGLDTRGGADGGVGPGTSQSDVMMLVHVYAGHRQISVLSIPRDTYVTAPSCLLWNNATGKVSDTLFTSQYSSWKITNAYSVGGPQCTVKAIQELTGLRVDRLVAIQFNGFKAIVDALGGVTMTFASPVIDANQGAVIPKAGVQTIDGEQALKLVRSRIVQGDSRGDLGRIDRQRLLVLAMLKKMTSTGLLADPGRLDSVMQTFAQNSTSANLDVDQLLSLATSLSGGAKIDFVTLPTKQDPKSEGLDMVASKADPLLDALAQDRVPSN